MGLVFVFCKEWGVVNLLKKINVENAVGMVMGHDVTQIIPGVKKEPLFRKGHIVTEKDIPLLLSIGKEHLYIYEAKRGIIHENEAAIRLAKAAINNNHSFAVTEPREGKVNIISSTKGLLKIDVERLNHFNGLGSLMMATTHTNRPVGVGEIVAGTRIIPLIIEEEKILLAEKICATGPIIKVVPYTLRKAGLVITGSEVKKGRIKDGFGPVVENKLSSYGVKTVEQTKIGDNPAEISSAISFMLANGVDIVIVTGGMSVDPDDVTPSAIRATGAEVVSYGVPVLPGSMFMLAYLQNKPIVGLPGCVMYNKVTVFDLVLPKLLVGEKITTVDLLSMGHGGLCLECPECNYPNCAFGKGNA